MIRSERISTILLLILVILHAKTVSAEVSSPRQCVPIPGAAQLWSKPQLHWLLIGEVHGSTEAPAAFLNLVCDARNRKRRVVVALERPASEQPALDHIMQEPEISVSRAELLAMPGWTSTLDGRSSEAMLRLILALHDLHGKYGHLDLEAFDAPYSGDSPGARDVALGHALLEIGNTHRRSLILVLCGNVHGMEARMFGYDTAAMFIPARRRLSLQITDHGGHAWIQTNRGCGPSEAGALDKDVIRTSGIYLDPSLAPYGKVDGILSLGKQLTASPPAVGEPDPEPACRTSFLQHR